MPEASPRRFRAGWLRSHDLCFASILTSTQLRSSLDITTLNFNTSNQQLQIRSRKMRNSPSDFSYRGRNYAEPDDSIRTPPYDARSPAATLLELPTELHISILSLCSMPDLVHVSRTCQQMNQIGVSGHDKQSDEYAGLILFRHRYCIARWT